MPRHDSMFDLMATYAGTHPVLVMLVDTLGGGAAGFLIGAVDSNSEALRSGIVYGSIAAVIGALVGIASISQAHRDLEPSPASASVAESGHVASLRHGARPSRHRLIAQIQTSRITRLAIGCGFGVAAFAAQALGLSGVCSILVFVAAFFAVSSGFSRVV